MESDYDPTPEYTKRLGKKVISEYIKSLKKVISEEITWGEHHHGAREQMLLALCRGLEVDPDTVIKIKVLELQACTTAGIPA